MDGFYKSCFIFSGNCLKCDGEIVYMENDTSVTGDGRILDGIDMVIVKALYMNAPENACMDVDHPFFCRKKQAGYFSFPIIAIHNGVIHLGPY